MTVNHRASTSHVIHVFFKIRQGDGRGLWRPGGGDATIESDCCRIISVRWALVHTFTLLHLDTARREYVRCRRTTSTRCVWNEPERCPLPNYLRDDT